ncbi:Uncharacterised protein [Shigella sonnei]|nr:Uncharacterised protein [Shigella sonnei]CSF72771.1 Uncharacterised protein [Shigella sonnei]CSG08211.1 Uncharacterised protein [Shigella sonnei]CSG34219.1 Uncharacterised protein [Shigella sonnei]CSG43720.1 Uncharacterised protein [Shigella sonnei]
MAHSGFGCRVQQTVGNGITRNRLQAKWGDKGFCRFGHGYADVGPAIAQTTHQFRGFIGSNTAANAENDFFTGQAHDDFSCRVTPEVGDFITILLLSCLHLRFTLRGAFQD